MPLKDVCLEITVGYVGSMSQEYIKDGIPMLRSLNIKSYWLNLNDLKYISAEFHRKISKSSLREGDVVIVRTGLPGTSCVIPKGFKELNCSDLVIARLDTQKINPYYLSFYFNSIAKGYVENQLVGAIQQHFNVGSAKEMIIDLPEIDVQDKIVKVLNDINSKIELNNRINTELEAMAKTLYDYWFVQFDFPDENGKPYKSSGGKMVWNEELRREVPEGWEIQKMSEWIDVDKSGDWGKDEEEGNFTKKVICFRGADINGLNGLDELKPPVRYILEKNSFKILKSHDLIIEISGGSPTQSTGRLAFITDATIKRFEHPLICSNFCKPVSIRNKKMLYNFVYYWNSLYDNGAFFGYEGKTSGIKNLLFDSFISSYYTVVPEKHLAIKFYDFMDNVQEKKQTALEENQTLASLRDWLLPMLMNGQVKVI